jgi:tRNA(fMet)-specific endonuclease VapC
MHLLDTDTLTHLYAGHPKVIANLQKLSDPIVTTTLLPRPLLQKSKCYVGEAHFC